MNQHVLHPSISLSLNEPQLQAVTHQQGALLIIAGAGSGKTRVITARIAHMLASHIAHPGQIIALTFTNKAAAEMKHRVAEFVGPDHELPFVGTFHSYALQLLKRYGALIELPQFSIIDEEDQQTLISDLLKRAHLHKQFTARQALYTISQAKNNPGKASEYMHPMLKEIAQLYEHEKKISSCIDFDDLLHHALKLYATQPQLKQQLQQRVRHILVDEYQDTNTIQHELLKHMGLADKKLAIDSICAVGDEDQSIYSWRGATVTNMASFARDFGPTTIVKIEQNYRSAQPILDAANELIQYNTQRTQKKLWSTKQGKNCINVLTCVSEYQEADVIAYITTLAHKQWPQYSIAVLYRTHAQSRAIEEALVKQSIPYTMIGGVQFYERKEIKDILAYLRLISNPFDRVALQRILNVPQRGLGPAVTEQLSQLYHDYHGYTAIELLQVLARQLPGAKAKAIMQMIQIFDGLSATMAPTDAYNTIVQRTAYTTYLTEKYEQQEADVRIANIRELYNAMVYMQQRNTPTLTAFLDEVSLMQDAISDRADETAQVMLMSLHAAKGLEFDIVILAGLEEHLIPTSRSLNDELAIEEERRLLYVGITRAREHLFLTHAQYRYIYGQLSPQQPTRFLDNITIPRTNQHDITHGRSFDIKKLLQECLGITTVTVYYAERASAVKKTKPLSPTQSISTSTTESATNTQSNASWKVYQAVKHATYGIGTIQHIEPRHDGAVLTIKFKAGTKKIIDRFVIAT